MKEKDAINTILNVEVIERLNAGLRKSGGDKPLMILTTEEMYDACNIGGIYIKFIKLNGFSENDDKDCPFIPIYKDVKPDDDRERFFRKGYHELG